MMDKLTIRLIFGLLLMLGAVFPAYADDAQLFDKKTPSAPFLAVSDIHFNPFFSCSKLVVPCPLIKQLNAASAAQWENILAKYDAQKLPTYGDDANYALLKLALLAIQHESKEYSPKFIIIPGDFLAHNLQLNYKYYSGDLSSAGYQNFVKKEYQFLAFEMQHYWGNVPIYSAIGNNDSYRGNYNVVANGQFFTDLAQIWSPLIHNHFDSGKLFLTTFSTAGYYEVTVPGEVHHQIIVLNSVLFSKKAQGAAVDAMAQKQLVWLNERLHYAESHQQKVWLVFHIPAGIDAYKVAKDPLHRVVSFWLPAYTKTFQDIINNYPSVVEAVIVSHTHMDSFYLMHQATQKLPEIFIPSISLSNGNNPGFKIFSYNPRTFQLQNYIVYYLPLDKQSLQVNFSPWPLEYNFNSIYQLNCKNCLLSTGMQIITKEGTAATAYQHYFDLSSPTPQPINQGKWSPYYWCAINNITVDTYAACLKQNKA